MHCVDLGESFPTHIFLQNLASIQPRTSRLKFADTNTQPHPWVISTGLLHLALQVPAIQVPLRLVELGLKAWAGSESLAHSPLLSSSKTYVATNSIRHLTTCIHHLDTRFSISNFKRSVLGCIDADFRDQILVEKLLARSTHSTLFLRP